ncbi:MAG: hypothetical protein VR68_11615 [Peptococcaceae bacterium BRH_c4a]|nr:MAG: hypothetical protein VR68_11615 [Peptococcaceae bacterium BRH_c4a]
MFKELQDNDALSEMQQISGAGKIFVIDGEKFEVLPATLGQLEEVADLWNEKIHPVVLANFLKANKENREHLYKLLGMAFAGKVSQEKFKSLRRDQVKEILDFFLIS